jgi:2-keto-4-pentenoate hydratase/2-oxohepta-3-ene-1,7-dioic acid hydratase in catechol pathway
VSPNEPRRRGKIGAFEIWFLAVFDPASRRALWLRLTTLAPRGGGDGRAMIWAAAFGDAARPPLALKTLAPLDALAYGEGFDLRLGDVELREGATRGEVRAGGRSIAWELHFDGAPARRARRIDALPLPVHASHGAERASFSGWFAVDGAKHELGPRARGVQEHIWGERQPDEISWIFAPELEGEDQGFAELASVRIGKRSPRATTLRLRGGGLDLEVGDVPGVLRGRANAAGPGVLEIRSASRRRLVIARATAAIDTFVGYVYRDPTGGEVHVAQSDLAACEIEVHERRGLLLRPARRFRAPLAALEIHRPEPLEGVSYLAFEDAGPAPPVPRVAASRPARSDQAELPRPSRILALGLTYADHLRETGTRPPKEPVVFEKPARTWLPEGAEVAIPSDAEMLTALEAAETGLSPVLAARFGFLPAMMDYEVELGLMLLEPLRVADLERASPRLGFFLANDLTARTCQVLGEGTRDPFVFWAIAKGFTGFLPVGDSLWIPPETSLDAWPTVTLRLAVNGELRQDGSTRDLCYSPRAMLRAAAKLIGGDLPEGLALVTGTPAGVAMQVPAWKRRVADRLLDRFGKLGAAFDGYAKSARFLRAGDAVRCDGGPLGTRTVRLIHPIVVAPAPAR